MSWLQTIAVFPQPPDSRPIPQVEQEILDELQFHVEMRTLDNISAGMSALEAGENALDRFGDFKRIHKICRRTLLGERIMLQRIQTVLTLALLGAVIFLGVEFYRGQRANEASIALMMQSLEKIANAAPKENLPAPMQTNVALNESPPVVTETIPRNGDNAVDPSITEIRVIYNKKMTDGSWSWSQISDETFPETTGNARYEADGKTCVLPVKLQPGKEYVIWLNSENFGNFKDSDGHSAVPFCLRFQTRL
jgi:hypothetical protein